MTGKRFIDVAISLIALIALLPLIVLIVGILFAFEGRPLLHRETRIGRFGKPFPIRKFRSMAAGVPGPSVAASNDERLTSIGRCLKPLRLDELPQLLNVIAGDMSLVGPRPLPEGHLVTLPPGDRDDLLRTRPGLIGPASVLFIAEDDALCGSGDPEALYLNTILPAKVAVQREYLQNWSLGKDIRIMLDTLLNAWSPAAWRASREHIRQLVEAGQ